MKITTHRVCDPNDGTLLAAVTTVEVETDEDVKSGAHFLSAPDWPLQVAAITHNAGEGFAPHYHPPVKRETVGTPEVLVVTMGSYRLTVFTEGGVEVESLSLSPGNIVTLLRGGHGAKALEDGSEMVEVKMGPYLGDADKVRFTGGK